MSFYSCFSDGRNNNSSTVMNNNTNVNGQGNDMPGGTAPLKRSEDGTRYR